MVTYYNLVSQCSLLQYMYHVSDHNKSHSTQKDFHMTLYKYIDIFGGQFLIDTCNGQWKDYPPGDCLLSNS